jgi:ferrochelatase
MTTLPLNPCPLQLGAACYCANRVSSFLPPKSELGSLAKTAVLLLAHGSPENPNQIPDFLRNVTGGRPLPPQVVEEIRHRYSLIGFSPLTCWTLLQADQLSQELRLPVFVGMRNWKPFIADAVKAIAAQKFDRVIAVCLAPQNSRTSVGLYRRAVTGPAVTGNDVTGSAVTGNDALPFTLDFVDEWHDQPLLAKAFAENLRAGWAKANAEYGGTLSGTLPIIFTAHSVPARTITEGDPYEAQSKETAQLVAKAAGLAADAWTFAFQSQGMSGGPGSANPWIGPTVEETILSLKAKGHRGVFIHPVGFLCDHVEVLYDIDIFFKQFAEKEGVRLWRAESLNGSKTLTAALADLVRGRVGAPSAL